MEISPTQRRIALSILFLGMAGGLLASFSCRPRTSTVCSSSPQDFSPNQLGGSSLPRKTLSLTFDDGPGARTLELAEFLHDQSLHATFFVIGKAAAGATQTLQRLRDLGHLVGNHTQNHTSMRTTANPVSEVRNTDKIIAPFVPGNVFLFRAPYGDWSTKLPAILNATDLRKYVGSVFWDIGGELTPNSAADWACWRDKLSVSACGRLYLKEIEVRERGIVLMHDVHSKTIDLVKLLIPQLKTLGYTFVRADEVPNLAEKIREAGGHPGEDLKPVTTTATNQESNTDEKKSVATESSKKSAVTPSIETAAVPEANSTYVDPCQK